MPVTFAIITTVAAFAPMMLWPGIMGEFMKYLPITLLVTLSSSLVVALVIMVSLFLFFRFSKTGVAMKATQQNENAAALMGIKTKKIRMVTWGISSMVGSVAGLLISPVLVEPYMMWDPMLKGFAGAVVGGMTSLPGAVFGAYIVGIVEHGRSLTPCARPGQAVRPGPAPV